MVEYGQLYDCGSFVEGVSDFLKVPSYTLSSYVACKVITPAQRDVLFDSFANRKNVIVCGNLGVGKTTFLNTVAIELHRLGRRIVLVQNFNEFSFPESSKILPIFTYNTPFEDYVKAIDSTRSSVIINELEAGNAKPLLHAMRRGRKDIYLGLSSCSDAGHALMRFGILAKTSFAEVADFIDLVLYLELDSANNRIIRHFKAVSGYNEKTSEFIFHDVDSLSSVQVAS